MKRTRFSESPIVGILKQADAGIKVKGLCREQGVSEATYYNWKTKYGGLEASDLKRLKEVEGDPSHAEDPWPLGHTRVRCPQVRSVGLLPDATGLADP